MGVLDRKLYSFTKQQVEDLLTYDIKNRALYSKDEHLKLLLTACLVNGFAEGVSKSLSSSPTGETLLSYIKSQEQANLQETFDRMVELSVRALRKRRKLLVKVPIAIDWHDVMYYGDPATPMVIGTQHKRGSNYAFEYLTASVLVDGERAVVAVLPLASKSSIHVYVRRILQRLQELGIGVRYVTMDSGFFDIDVIHVLEESSTKYILRMRSTSKTKRMRLWPGRRFSYTTTVHKRREPEQASFDVLVAYDNVKKYKYLFATNMRCGADTALELYNKQWGIETSYRMCNQFLIKTTSKNYVVRLFYYLFACLIYNVWILYNNHEQCAVV